MRKAALKEKVNVKDAVFTAVLEGLDKGEKEEARARYCIWESSRSGSNLLPTDPTVQCFPCPVLRLQYEEHALYILWKASFSDPYGSPPESLADLAGTVPIESGQPLSPKVGARPVIECVINMDKKQELFM